MLLDLTSRVMRTPSISINPHTKYITTGTTTADTVYWAVAKALNRAKGSVRLMTTFFRVSTPSRVIKRLLRHSMPIMSITNTGRAVSKTEIAIPMAYLITPFCRMMLA